jgi:hypothetical protein
VHYYQIVLIFSLFLTAGVRTVFAASYTTNFPGTENPISEGGAWINGKTTGVAWQNVKTTTGFAQLTVGNPSAYDDSTAILAGTWGADQYVRAVVKRPNIDANYTQEFEIRLRSTMTANSSRGYEVLLTGSGAHAASAQIVRWNGAPGDFTVLTTSGPGGNVTDGDILEAQMVGTTITVKINGRQVLTATDSTYSNGSPGMGFFTRNPSPPAHGFSSYTASNSPIGGDTTPPNAPSDLTVR